MKVSIQRATLGDHGIGYGLLVKITVRRYMIVAAEHEPHPDRRSPQEERQIENTDGAAQREDGRDGRCSRKPVSRVSHDTLLHGHVQGAAYRGGHRPAVRSRTRPCTASTYGQLSHHAERGSNCSEAPNG
jgi:hypothetical protein